MILIVKIQSLSVQLVETPENVVQRSAAGTDLTNKGL